MSDSLLEPGSELGIESGDVPAHAIVSIAISLKRIADSLSHQPGATNLFDFVGGIYENSQPRSR